MNGVRRPGLFAGMFVAGLLTASLLGVLFLGWMAFGLPFPPFDVFDWTVRLLPGAFVAASIENMVMVIQVLGVEPLAAAAKVAEQSMAIGGGLITGLIVGVLFFLVLRRLRGRHEHVLGLACGLAFGLPVTLISHQLSQTARTSPAVSALWILAAFVVWGLVLGWASRRVMAGGAKPEAALPQSLADGAGRAVPCTPPRADDVVSARRGLPALPCITDRLPESASVQRIGRRRFLVRFGGSTAAITVLGAVVGNLAEAGRRAARRDLTSHGRWSATHPLPNADSLVKPAPGTRPEFTALERHYRIDIDTTPPEIDEARWKLKVFGLVERPVALALNELRRYPALDQFITLACVSNPVGGSLIGTTRWTGVSLRLLLPDLRLRPNATHLKIRAADGFFEVVSLETVKADERVMLAYAWDSVPLTPDHGFPLRIYIPDLYGMKQPKWIDSIEPMDHWEPGYWVTRGWDKEPHMKAAAVIDTVGTKVTGPKGSAQPLVSIGGIAHAGARGISKVEVQVDDGLWQPALLRAPISPLTWVVWRYDWPFQPGKHAFRVRCFEADGTPQIADRASPRPSGATGLHSKTQML